MTVAGALRFVKARPGSYTLVQTIGRGNVVRHWTETLCRGAAPWVFLFSACDDAAFKAELIDSPALGRDARPEDRDRPIPDAESPSPGGAPGGGAGGAGGAEGDGPRAGGAGGGGGSSALDSGASPGGSGGGGGLSGGGDSGASPGGSSTLDSGASPGGSGGGGGSSTLDSGAGPGGSGAVDAGGSSGGSGGLGMGGAGAGGSGGAPVDALDCERSPAIGQSDGRGNPGGGQPFVLDCGPAELLVGVRGLARGALGGVAGLCQTVEVSGGLPRFVGPIAATATAGGGEIVDATCPAGHAVVAFGGRAGLLMDAIVPTCALVELEADGDLVPGPNRLDAAPAAGVDGGGNPFAPAACPGFAVGVFGGAGDSLDGFGLRCGALRCGAGLD